MTVEVGDIAPLFQLADRNNGKMSLADMVGKRHAMLVFTPFAFSALADDELGELVEDASTFDAYDIVPMVISCDSPFVLGRWGADQASPFVMLSDYWPHGQVARRYGVFNEALGCPNRSTVLIDRSGVIAEIFSSPDLGTPRDRSQYEKALAKVGRPL